KIAHKLKKKIVTYNHSIEWELVPNALGPYFAKKFIYFLSMRIARKLYNKCDLLLVPTNEVAEKLSEHKIKPKKSIVPLGVDTDTFSPTSRKNKAKVAVGIDPKHFVVGYAGRIAREKDLKTLMRAFMRVKKTNKDVRLLIVGDGIESLKDTLASRESVIVTGSKDNVIPFFHAMDVYAITSLTETTSLTTLEAMACGLPVIATKVGMIKEYIKHRSNGYLIKRGDAYSLYRFIADILKDPLLGPKLGKKARQTVVESFSWEKTARMIKEEIEKA
ncbi:glycosyltransferase family 4 protein, partial [Candidatus Woesearchaeota archaeon]|nr:glycosyltransferase family 4 protein [Candidatus Woesearchaeota archaeon]